VRPSRRTYSLHPPGIIYLLTVFFIAVGGFNSQNNLLFWAFGVGIAGLLISGIVSGAPLMHLQIKRARTETVGVAEHLRLGYEIRNNGRLWPAYALRIDEVISKSARSDWMDRIPAVMAHVGPGQVSGSSTRVRACRRGVHELGRVRVSTTFPFGLIRKSLYFDLPQTVRVHPRIAELQREVKARIQPGLIYSTRSHNRAGQGDEFFALREYMPGDPMRTISWRASARKDTLVVKQHAALAPPRLWIAVEPPSADIDERSFENTISFVASLYAQASRDQLAPGLQIAWAGMTVAPSSGSAGLDRALEALTNLQQQDATSHATATNQNDPDLIVSFSAIHAEGVLSGADTSDWAVDDIETVLMPAAHQKRSKRKSQVAISPTTTARVPA